MRVRHVNELYNEVFDEIENWDPKKKYSKEELYRDDLVKHLRKELNRPNPLFLQGKVTVKIEAGRGLCDICVNESIGIELKKDLRKKSEIDRLIGQITRYKKDYDHIIVVLVGNTDLNSKDDLAEIIDGLGDNPLFLNQQQIEIIDKSGQDNKEDENQFGGFSIRTKFF